MPYLAARLNPDGQFVSALNATHADRKQRWSHDDIHGRFDFALRCAYAHGTAAIRTRLNSFEESEARTAWRVFRDLRDTWSGKIDLQAVSFVSVDRFASDSDERLPAWWPTPAEILGAVTTTGEDHADLPPQFDDMLDRLFALASDHGLDIDLHVDESGHKGARALIHIARASLRHKFKGTLVCGHCCSLSLQPEDFVAETLLTCADAGLSVVSLPTCNMYLQDRQTGRTPRWRGVTLLHELSASAIPVAIGSDNCRDPCFGFGDHDMLEVFGQAVRIAHLDMNYAGLGAFRHRDTRGSHGTDGTWTDCQRLPGRPDRLSRPPHERATLAAARSDRVVLRKGRPSDAVLPDYRELDQIVTAADQSVTA